MRKFLKRILSEKTKIFKDNIKEIQPIFEIGERAVLYKAICKHTLISGVFEITERKFVKNEDYIDGLWAYRLNIKDLENQWWGEMVMKKAPEMAPLSFSQLVRELKESQRYIKN